MFGTYVMEQPPRGKKFRMHALRDVYMICIQYSYSYQDTHTLNTHANAHICTRRASSQDLHIPSLPCPIKIYISRVNEVLTFMRQVTAVTRSKQSAESVIYAATRAASYIVNPIDSNNASSRRARAMYFE